MPSHKILHLTDCHLLAEAGRTMLGIDTFASFQSTLNHANQHHGPFDLLLLTGDLAQDPCAASYRRLKRSLDNLATPYLCLPGNHDAVDIMRAELAGCDDAYRLDHWRIISLNSQKADSPVGRLAESELTRLESLLRTEAEKPALLAMHHPCLSCGTPWLDPMQIENGEQLIRLLQGFPQVKLLLCGHIHQEFNQKLDHAMLLATPSTCFQFTPGALEFSLDNSTPGYRIVELFDNGDWRSQCERLEEGSFNLDFSAHGY